MQPPGALTGAKILLDGGSPPAGPKRGQYLLRRNDGLEVTAYFKGGFPDPTPILVVDNQSYRLAPALAWYEWAWAGLPLLLMLVGGAIGGAVGAMALTANIQIFRAPLPPALRYLFTGMLSVIAFFLWLVIGAALMSMFRR